MTAVSTKDAFGPYSKELVQEIQQALKTSDRRLGLLYNSKSNQLTVLTGSSCHTVSSLQAIFDRYFKTAPKVFEKDGEKRRQNRRHSASTDLP